MVVLGATGSIGLQALDVVRSDPAAFRVVGLAARGNKPDLLRRLVEEFRPEHVGLPAAAPSPGGERWPAHIHSGPHAAETVVRAARPDVVLHAIPGFAGLAPALAALEAPCLLAMSGKEAIVAAGHLLAAAAREGGGTIVPVDSEPAAVAQCLCAAGGPGPAEADLRRVYLTASGGPFWARRDLSPEYLEHVPPEEAVRHPRWSMGPKISVDSATLFNKGLEAIEISRLFGLPMDMIHIIVHPQSAVHALIELCDGSLLAHLGPADMRVPIGQALYHPRRAPSAPARLDLEGLHLDFAGPEPSRWPCLAAALAAGAAGGTMPAAVSAADEVLVHEFLARRISFGAIGRGLWAVIRAHTGSALDGGRNPVLQHIVEADGWARDFAARWAAGDEGDEPAGRAARAHPPGRSEGVGG